MRASFGDAGSAAPALGAGCASAVHNDGKPSIAAAMRMLASVCCCNSVSTSGGSSGSSLGGSGGGVVRALGDAPSLGGEGEWGAAAPTLLLPPSDASSCRMKGPAVCKTERRLRTPSTAWRRCSCERNDPSGACSAKMERMISCGAAMAPAGRSSIEPRKPRRRRRRAFARFSSNSVSKAPPQKARLLVDSTGFGVHILPTPPARATDARRPKTFRVAANIFSRLPRSHVGREEPARNSRQVSANIPRTKGCTFDRLPK